MTNGSPSIISNASRDKMTEDPWTLELTIRHYQELLKLARHTPATRQRVTDLLAEAQAQLPLLKLRQRDEICQSRAEIHNSD
jgi:hypothetical protein